MKLSEFDFSELGHYIDSLEVSRDADERARYAGIVGEIVAALPRPSLGAALVLAASRHAAWGGPFDCVRREFALLAQVHAGWSAAQVLRAEQRAESAQHGRRGGRPRSGHDAEWLRLYDEMRAKNPRLSTTEACARIAARWADESGERRHWRTVARVVARARNGQ
jgi:hypothetical protein